MADEPEGKLEVAIRVLGNELFAFSMLVDDMKIKWVFIGVVSLIALLWAVGQFYPMVADATNG